MLYKEQVKFIEVSQKSNSINVSKNKVNK